MGAALLDGVTVVARHHPVMGTDLELQITAATEATARSAEAAALAEARRLEAAFTVFDPGSDLCRWRSGADAQPSADLAPLLALAARWQDATHGAFNPRTGVLTDRWRRAEREGAPPSASDLVELAAAVAGPAFAVVDGGVVRQGDTTAVDLNAFAKGHVVDRVARFVADRADVARVVVNAGGDLVHRGAGSVRVAVEDPHRPYDNAPPLDRIEVAGLAVATSGRSRRWFTVGAERWSRVLDPRSGRPVAHTAAATVVAPDAATADVLATAASVLAPAETLDLVATLRTAGSGPVEALVVEADGTRHATPGWSALRPCP